MADVTAAYKPHPRKQHQNYLVPGARDDDDYVDYHDIWNDKPPTQLVKEHKQVCVWFYCSIFTCLVN